MTIDWSKIEKYYDEGTTAGFALSLLEAERLIRKILLDKRIPGKNHNEKINLVSAYLNNPTSLHHAREATKQILELNLPPIITRQSAEQILRAYYAAINDLNSITVLAVKKIQFRRQLIKLKRLAARTLLLVVLGVVLAIILTLFLGETQAGKNLTEWLLNFSRLILYRALPIVLGTITLLAIIMGLIMRKTKKPPGRESPAKSDNSEF